MAEGVTAPARRGTARSRVSTAHGRASTAKRRPEPLERRIASRLAALLPEYPRVSLCVAFSGGIDSTVLLTALARRARRSGVPALRALHVDHGLSPQSAGWAEHCRVIAAGLDVPLAVVRAEVHRPRGASLEAAAREARYAVLAEQLRDSEVLLTAQHMDDQLETVLLQLLRGAGLRGLAAMPAVAPFARGRLVRPLLGLERAELEGWARERGLAWVEDPTNVDERLDRNYLRRRIVPLLRARWPAAGRTVSRSAMHVAEAQRLLDLLAGADAERAAVGDALSVRRLRALTPERRRNALRFWIARRGGPLPDGKRLAEIAGPVIDARPDAHPEVAWGDRVVRREGDRLGLAKRGRGDPGRARPDPSACLARPEIVPDIHGPIDLDAVRGPLTVALRRGGERLRLRRGGPSRALKTLLQEARIPSTERASMPLLWCGERLLAAGDLWVDASIRAGEDTVRRARLVWHTASYIC